MTDQPSTPVDLERLADEDAVVLLSVAHSHSAGH